MSEARIPLDYSALGAGFFGETSDDGKHKIHNISGAAWSCAHLWTVSDEGSTFERLSPAPDGFAEAVSYELSDFFDGLKAGKEVDMESLAWDSQRLWICASHSIKRTELGSSAMETIAENLGLQEVETVKTPRTLLGFIPLNKHGEPKPEAGVSLPLKSKKGSLLWAIGKHGGPLGQAIEPNGDGIDIEGLAVKGDHILIGVRRPVIDGAAIVLRAKLEIDDDDMSIEKLDGERLATCLLPLNGLGVRDLQAIGENVLVLAGPSGKDDGPFVLYLWRNALAVSAASGAIPPDQVTRVVELKVEEGQRPEGMTLLGDGRLLIVYDGRSAGSYVLPGVVEADALTLPIAPNL